MKTTTGPSPRRPWLILRSDGNRAGELVEGLLFALGTQPQTFAELVAW
jgi:hypothetical protein